MAIRLLEHDIAPQSESSTELPMSGYDIVPPTETRRYQSVPVDVLLDVFLRLPVKTLGLCRCVSKSWDSLIVNTNRYFSKLYLKNTDTDYYTKIIVTDFSNVKSKLYIIDGKTKNIKELRYPRSLKSHRFYIEGSINGVLFIRSKHPEIGIWNPLSQRYKEILCSPRVSPPVVNLETVITYGFGYEKTSDDYKVVALLNFWNKKVGSILPDHYYGWIYSLKLNTWKRLEGFSYALFKCFNISGVFCNGALHWITKDKSILGFNLIDENFYLVPNPPTTPLSTPHLSVLGGCLSFSGYYGLNIWEIWVMNKYGIKDSWSKININHDIVEYPCVEVKPIAYLDKRQVLILQIHRLELPQMIILYDISRHSVEIVQVAPEYDYRDYYYIAAHPYVETLECSNHHEKESAGSSINTTPDQQINALLIAD